MISTTILIDQRERTATFVDRNSFILGETYEKFVMSGIKGCDLATLSVFFYDPDSGTLLAGAFNTVGDTPTIVKEIDTYAASFSFLSPECIALFGSTPPATKEMVMVVRDASLIFVRQSVTLTYAAILNAGPSPEYPAMEAAIAAHSLDLDAHPALIAKADVANVQKFLVDSDNATFADLCSLFNALVDALQAPRA